jgi:hypothetical protein
MLRILSRLLQEKLFSRIFKKPMLLTDSFSGSSVFERFRGLLPFLQSKYPYSVKLKRRQYKIHAYRNYKNNTAFFLEASKEDPLKSYMTAFGADIKKGDFIVIEDDHSSTAYRVESIDYYLDPPNLWMALLAECRDLPKQI